MIGKIIGAGIGRRLAGPDQGLKGALIGAAAPWLIRRAFTPLGFAALGAYGAIKLYDRHRARRNMRVVPPETVVPEPETLVGPDRAGAISGPARAGVA
jgi:hypothetical protein